MLWLLHIYNTTLNSLNTFELMFNLTPIKIIIPNQKFKILMLAMHVHKFKI